MSGYHTIVMNADVSPRIELQKSANHNPFMPEKEGGTCHLP